MSEILFEQKSFPSADGVSTVAAYIWRPTHVQPRAIIQLSHGMCEYVERYDAWARRFVAEGFAFCGSDHLGHGNTAPDEEALGYTAKRNGAEYLVEDLYRMTKEINARFPEVPVVLYGHSMCSFAARLYLTRHADALAAALISGTAGPESPTGLALKMAHGIAALRGDTHRSKLLTALAFGSYNQKFKEERL